MSAVGGTLQSYPSYASPRAGGVSASEWSPLMKQTLAQAKLAEIDTYLARAE